MTWTFITDFDKCSSSQWAGLLQLSTAYLCQEDRALCPECYEILTLTVTGIPVWKFLVNWQELPGISNIFSIVCFLIYLLFFLIRKNFLILYD